MKNTACMSETTFLYSLYLIQEMKHSLKYHTLHTKYCVEQQDFCGIVGYLPLKFKLIGYLQIGYCLNSYRVTALFSYILFVTSTILTGYSIIHLLFDTPCLKNNWVFQKYDWVNIPKSSLSVSLCFLLAR